jgi:dTDP-4-dehydrorhamnose reductase
MRKVLVTGANGQLGHAISLLSAERTKLACVLLTREDMDLTSDDSIQSAMLTHRPDVVINCAAYTAVDKAEEERDLAKRINGEAVGVIVKVCEEIGAKLIQISTDYVFDGNNDSPYPVDFPTSPINWYGETKLHGETEAARCSRYLIVRAGWLYGDYGKNFASTMRRLFQEKEELRVVDDQTGRPTKSSLVAEVCLDAAENDTVGIVHVGGDEIMSWYDFARRLHAEAGETVTQRIIPIPSSEYPTPAKRPKYSVLEITGT